jgi:hypothetical protein
MSIASQTKGQRSWNGTMQVQEAAQIPSQLSNADDISVEFGLLSAFFAMLTILLTVILFLWDQMMFFVLWIMPLSALSTLIFGCIVLVKARSRRVMK